MGKEVRTRAAGENSSAKWLGAFYKAFPPQTHGSSRDKNHGAHHNQRGVLFAHLGKKAWVDALVIPQFNDRFPIARIGRKQKRASKYLEQQTASRRTSRM